MEILIGSDHGGYKLKQEIIKYLNELGHSVEDCGCYTEESCDYPDIAQEVAKKVSEIIGYPVEASIGYPTPGSFGTWAGIENKIPTITLELDEEIDVKELREPMFKIFEMLEKY